MLVLTRYENERIFIGEGASRITVQVVRVDRGKVRIGIEAPGQLILREEVDREQAEGDRHESL
jgi:carbon storage regulator CsrA